MNETDRLKLLRDSLKTLNNFVNDLSALLLYMFKMENVMDGQEVKGHLIDQRFIVERINKFKCTIQKICTNCEKTTHTYLNNHGQVTRYETLETASSFFVSDQKILFSLSSDTRIPASQFEDQLVQGFVNDLNVVSRRIQTFLSQRIGQDDWCEAFKHLDALIQFTIDSATNKSYDILFFKSPSLTQTSSYISVLEKIDEFLSEKILILTRVQSNRVRSQNLQLNQNNNSNTTRFDYEYNTIMTQNTKKLEWNESGSSSEMALTAIKLNCSILISTAVEYLYSHLRDLDYSRIFESSLKFLLAKLLDLLAYLLIIIVFKLIL